MAANKGALALSLLCVVASSFFTTFGLFLQKIAQRRQAASTSCSRAIADREAYRRWTCVLWFIGLLCFTIFSFLLDLYAFATLEQSLVVPLGATLSVAENQIFAPVALGEHFDRCRDTWASVMMIGGAFCTTFFGPGGVSAEPAEDPTPDMDYAEMKAYFGGLFIEPAFLVFEALTMSLLVACLFLLRFERCHKLHFIMLGYAAAFIGGQQNVFLKGVGKSLTTAFGGDTSVFADWVVYLFTFFMASLAALQLFFLNLGLARFEALNFIPTYTVLYITNGTFLGLVFYQEYRLMPNIGWVMYFIGCVLIAVAMFILATKPKRPTEDAHDKLQSRPAGPQPVAECAADVVSLEDCHVQVVGCPLSADPQPPWLPPGVPSRKPLQVQPSVGSFCCGCL
mmetsp:Transcript_26826/g.73767  ORF Transcript_26826/g.73767 Transcript_26826/m.73767 type:complete len:396 (-) Transcript_26826:168-1355(-)